MCANVSPLFCVCSSFILLTYTLPPLPPLPRPLHGNPLQVRNQGAVALSKLMPLTTRVDPIVTDLLNGITQGEPLSGER